MQPENTNRCELAPFVLYKMDVGAIGVNAQCCYESDSTKLICTLIGPQFDSKYSKHLPTIILQLNGLDEKSTILCERIKSILLKCVVVEDYPKAIFRLTIEVLQHQKIDLLASIINLVCYSCAQAGIALRDIFTGVSVFGWVRNGVFEVTLKPSNSGDAKQTILELSTLKRNKNVVHINVSGSVGSLQLQKMISIGLSANDTISKYIEKLLTQPNSNAQR